ncbi:hypothetical protein F2Q70_00009382 [Brassica cretica]|uniref:glutathione transferase n=1 Tax=Brassica cretica TaxID=69181 RepID=A0A8S9MAM0_BRACR|nr:hypothetical protein F2Q70_00009382 [Brassica cretica]
MLLTFSLQDILVPESEEMMLVWTSTINRLRCSRLPTAKRKQRRLLCHDDGRSKKLNNAAQIDRPMLKRPFKVAATAKLSTFMTRDVERIKDTFDLNREASHKSTSSTVLLNLKHCLTAMLKKGLTTDQAVVAEEEAKLAKVLDVYEARLKEFKYLAGDTFTLTDLHHIPTVKYLLGTPTKKLFTERPRVNEWVAEITKRPASQKILQ